MTPHIIVVTGEIGSMLIDAVVNPPNSQMDCFISGGGSHAQLNNLRPGAAAITSANASNSKYIIRAVPPKYSRSSDSEETITKQFKAAYKNSLKLAKENGCKSIAFPILAAQTNGYPIRRACQEAIEAIFESENVVDTIMIVANRKNEKHYETFRDTLNVFLENSLE